MLGEFSLNQNIYGSTEEVKQQNVRVSAAF